ncbi:MAG: DNA methylase [Spirochaetia bacterium]|jgi:adenine-specific DNA methylase
MAIEDRFDISFIGSMALKEKQIQQNYRPIIAVHKWFARRPGTLFRGLILSEFGTEPLPESFFSGNDFPGRLVADPFMGGGTPILEANRVGCDVIGFDINPMATWIVQEEIKHLDLQAYRAAADQLMATLAKEVGSLYLTDCPLYGDRDVPAKYFIWVKVVDCEKCGREVDLFPGYLLAEDRRHPLNVLICADCGELNEVAALERPGKCTACGSKLTDRGPARRNRCACPGCGHLNTFPRPSAGPPKHRMVAIEYYNPHHRNGHEGRFFKKPDKKDLKRAAAAAARYQALRTRFVPDQEILPGDETDRLHRWGYRHYREMFSDRQLLGLELSCRLIDRVPDERVRHALATNLSDLLRYQNMLCRYDTMALKSLDIFSIHGFPVGLVECESNFLGIKNGNGANVGSGGWANVVEKYVRAKIYCESPFEVRQRGAAKATIPIRGEWIGENHEGRRSRGVTIRCTSSTDVQLKPGSLDAVFTDPPYFGNVQYGELMDFCYVWLRGLVGVGAEGFDRPSSRSKQELTGNDTQGRGIDNFTEGLSTVYRTMAEALKPGAPFAFTFHHNSLDAYRAVGVAMLDAGFVCSAALPCPAEMSGSIHIHGTGSSIVDTVFVCRSYVQSAPRGMTSVGGMIELVRDEVHQLRKAGLKATIGDVRCIVYGHLTSMAVAQLREGWRSDLPTAQRLQRFSDALSAFGEVQAAIEDIAGSVPAPEPTAADTLPLFS